MILVLAFLAILSSAQARCSPWWGSLTCSECVVRKSLFQPCGWILTNPEDTNSGMCGRANGKKGKAAKIIHNLMTTKEMCATLDGVNSEALSISAQVAAEISPTDEQMNQVVEVTGLSKEKAIKLLKEIGGNVQAAIDSHLEGGSAALTSNSNEAMRGSAPTEESSTGGGKNVLVMVAGQHATKDPDGAEVGFYASLCSMYKFALTAGKVMPANVHIVSVLDLAKGIKAVEEKSDPPVPGLCTELKRDIAVVQKITASGAKFSKHVIDLIKTPNAAKDRLMVVMLGHGLYSSNENHPDATTKIDAGLRAPSMQVTELRDALNVNSFKSVVMVADFCYSSMIALKANIGLPNKLAAAMATGNAGIVSAIGQNSALQTQFCTCNGNLAKENNVLKSNILFFGAPKYLEAHGGTSGLNLHAIPSAVVKCAIDRQWVAGEVFALPNKTPQIQEEFRACLPSRRKELFPDGLPLEYVCTQPDVCMYQGVM